MARAGITTERVVDEAVALVEVSGIERVSLAAIAERLGVTTPSLYKHIGGTDDLHRRIASRARAELGEVIARAAVGKSGADALAAIAFAYRDWARAHPGTYPLTLRAISPDDDPAVDERTIGAIYSVLEGFGLSGDSLVDATRMLRAILHGFVALEAAGGFGLPRELDRSFDVAVAALERALTEWPRGYNFV